MDRPAALVALTLRVQALEDAAREEDCRTTGMASTIGYEFPHPPVEKKKRIFWSERVKIATNSSTSIHFDAHVLKAMEPELSMAAEGRKRAQGRQYSVEVMKALCSSGLQALTQERTLEFDTAQFPFREAFQSLLQIGCPLESVHMQFHSDSGRKKDRREKLALMLPLTDSRVCAEFHRIYESFLCKVIAPHVYAHMGCAKVVVQCFPCVRMHRPNEFSIGPHCDAQYQLPDGNINCE
jgi:hypothetical protein